MKKSVLIIICSFMCGVILTGSSWLLSSHNIIDRLKGEDNYVAEETVYAKTPNAETTSTESLSYLSDTAYSDRTDAWVNLGESLKTYDYYKGYVDSNNLMFAVNVCEGEKVIVDMVEKLTDGDIRKTQKTYTESTRDTLYLSSINCNDAKVTFKRVTQSGEEKLISEAEITGNKLVSKENDEHWAYKWFGDEREDFMFDDFSGAYCANISEGEKLIIKGEAASFSKITETTDKIGYISVESGIEVVREPTTITIDKVDVNGNIEQVFKKTFYPESKESTLL